MMRLGNHCGKTLRTWAQEDDTLWVLDGDLADSNGAIHFAEAVPERFVMAGIAEQGMVSMAAGMASCGQRPWVFSFAAFLAYRAYDQVRVCLSHARRRPLQPKRKEPRRPQRRGPDGVAAARARMGPGRAERPPPSDAGDPRSERAGVPSPAALPPAGPRRGPPRWCRG